MAHLGVKIKFRWISLGCTKPTLSEEALQSSKESEEDLPNLQRICKGLCSQGTQNQPPCHDQQSSYQKNVHVFSWIYIHAACDIIHYIFCVWSGCKAGNHTEQVLATTSCKIVEALCVKIVFPNTVHHQGRTLASARDFPLSSFHSCPCKFWIHVFHGIVTTFNW